MSEQQNTGVLHPIENKEEMGNTENTVTTTLTDDGKSKSKLNLRKKDLSKFEAFFDSDSDSELMDKAKYRSRYHSVSNEKRLKLIKLVMEQGKKIKPAARKLGINYSTAKSICQIYKREGRTTKKDLPKPTPVVKKTSKGDINIDSSVSSETHPESHQESAYLEEISRNSKSKAEKPRHDELEASSKRKKVKGAEKSTIIKINKETNKTEETKPEIKVEMKSEHLAFPVKTEEPSKVANAFATPMNLLLANAGLQKPVFQPMMRIVPNLSAQNALIQYQLQQAQKTLLPVNPNQNIQQQLTQLLASQQLAQRINQIPTQPQFDIQKNIIKSQEMQMLNKMIANNLLNRYGMSNTSAPIFRTSQYF